MGHVGEPPPERTSGGALRFARYALAPNRLGYCGPSDNVALFEQAMALGRHLPGGRAGQADPSDPEVLPARASAVRHPDADQPAPGHVADVVGGLRELARGFEGAWPYLELIAEANGIPDPLDDRVVCAYWLGGRGLERVSAMAAGNHATTRFRGRSGTRWPHVRAALEPGASPSHAFHVMVVGPWIGMLRGGVTEAPLEVLNSCRVRRGRVLSVDGDTATVSTDRIGFSRGRLALREGEPDVIVVRLGEGGEHPCGPVECGDVVSVHWDWVCEVIDGRTARAVGIAERRALSRANVALRAADSPELG